MSLPVFQATVVNDSGDIIPSPVITVVIESSGLPATLFSDRNGTVPLGTGGEFTGGVDGFSQFYAAPNEYRVTASDSGSGFSITWRYVILGGTASLANVQSSPTDATVAAVLNNETTHIGGNENWTTANYQPEAPQGVGVVRFLQNKSGAGHTPNQTGITGSVLGIMFFNAVTGNIEYSGVTATGTYKQVDGINTNANNAALYVRTA